MGRNCRKRASLNVGFADTDSAHKSPGGLPFRNRGLRWSVARNRSSGCDQEDTAVVELLTCNFAVLAIAALYFTWKDRVVKASRRRTVLRQRVAYLLWAAAERA